ncbi:homoserine dehydrogenase [Panacagrimonas sp.]|uniref:homoserine dehydrogenase n=1 Tax=Panacagrimonas sp. TaxID=2480088 RepID=UPI003B525ECF
MSDPIRVGLVGLGTVGQGVLRVLRNNVDEIERRVGRRLVVTHVATKDLALNSEPLDGITVSDDALASVRDAEVDVFVEVMGGYTIAKQVMLAAIARGKPVVTANKALLAEHGNDIFGAAAAAGVAVGFEAAVAGGIPIIKAVREGLSGNRIDSVAGIINGTCNYILTQMTMKGQGFAEALADAQKLGYAEADPTFDIEGVDSAHKLALLASIAFGMPLAFKSVYCEGISKIGAQDIQAAQALGYRIKLLGLTRRDESGVSMRVHPTLVPDDQLIARVDGVVNAVVAHGNAVGTVGFFGRGAGGDPTASAIVADLVDVARNLGADARHQVPVLGFRTDALQPLPLLPIAEVHSSHFLRLSVADEAGVLKAITSVLAESEISIEGILQKEPREHEDASVALITSVVQESRFETALQRLLALPFVRDGVSHIRVEHFRD